MRSRIPSKLIFSSEWDSSILYESKQGRGVVSCTTFLLLVTGVRADPKHSFSYDIIRIYGRILTFDFSLKHASHFFVRYLLVGVVGTIFFSVSMTCGATHAGRILFDTNQKRENSRVWSFEVRVMLLLGRSRA